MFVKYFICELCNKRSDNNQHHKTHLSSEKHNLIKKNKILQLEKENLDSTEINDIINNLESKVKIIMKRGSKSDSVSDSTSTFDKIKYKETLFRNIPNIISDEENDIKLEIMSIIKKTHQLFYDHQINGEKAISDFMKLLSLILLKPLFNDKTSYIFEKSLQIKKNMNESDYNKYIGYCTNIIELTKEQNINTTWRHLVRDFLIPLFGGYFVESDKKLNCNNNSCLIQVITCFNEIPTILKWENNTNAKETYLQSNDIYSNLTGDIHEYFKNHYGGTGKELGQFFTPKKIIKAILIGLNFNKNIQISKNNKIYDPCVGSGGMLINAFKHNTNLTKLYGGETDIDTIKWAFQSLLITTGEIANDNLNIGDSIINKENKDCNIITNCPFNIRMNYNKEKESYIKKYKLESNNNTFENIYPKNLNDVEALFIQHCVYNLGENCSCAIILPYGKLFESKELRFIDFRKWLLNTVDISKIMLMPRGVFDYANVLTCVMIFTKNKCTQKIDYYRINKECNNIYSSITIDRKMFENNIMTQYSLCHSDYIHHQLNLQYKGDLVSFNDLFTIITSNISSGSIENINNGIYKFVTGAKYESWKQINTYDEEGEFIFIGVGGNGDSVPIKYYNKKFKFSNLMGKLVIKEKYKDKINIKFMYNLLLKNQSYIEHNMQKGSSNRTLHYERLKTLQIIIPTLDFQNAFIERISQFNEKNELLLDKIKHNNTEKESYISSCF